MAEINIAKMMENVTQSIIETALNRIHTGKEKIEFLVDVYNILETFKLELEMELHDDT